MVKTQYTGIFLLQETHSTRESVALWEREWGGKIIFSHGESNIRGVALLIQNNLDIDIIGKKMWWKCEIYPSWL